MRQLLVLFICAKSSLCLASISLDFNAPVQERSTIPMDLALALQLACPAQVVALSSKRSKYGFTWQPWKTSADIHPRGHKSIFGTNWKQSSNP